MTTEKKKTHSFKSLRVAGVLKSRDLYRVNVNDLVVVPGNNERDEDERFWTSIDQLHQYLLDGGTVPPIEVRVNPTTGATEVIQGHRRRLAYLRVIPKLQAKARDAGLSEEKVADLAYVECLPFTGNDVERVARIASGNEHLPLTDLETGRVYARLQNDFKLNVSEVARITGHPRARVDRLLSVATANHDVQEAVRNGTIKSTEAAKLVKQHGDDAGAVIGDMADKAKAHGKKRVTSGIATGFSLPKPLVADLHTRVSNLVSRLPKITQMTLAGYKAEPDQYDPDEFVQVPLAMLAGLTAAHSNVADKLAERDAKVAAKLAAAPATEEDF